MNLRLLFLLLLTAQPTLAVHHPRHPTFDLKRPVKDQTGLPGEFAFTLEWSPTLGEPSDQPSLFAAVQDQLGLRLESTKGPIEMFVVDHVEKPSEN